MAGFINNHLGPNEKEIWHPINFGEPDGNNDILLAPSQETLYIIKAPFEMPYSLKCQGSIRITDAGQGANKVTWTASACFKDTGVSPANIAVYSCIFLGGAGTQVFDLNAVGSKISVTTSTLAMSGEGGNINNSSEFILRHCTISGISGGFEFNNAGLMSVDTVFLVSGGFVAPGALIKVSGHLETVFGLIGSALINYLPGNSCVDFDTNLTFGAPLASESISLQGTQFSSSFGATSYADTSLKEDDPRLVVSDNAGVGAESIIVGAYTMQNNALITTIARKAADEIITAFADAGGGQITVTCPGHTAGNGEEVIIDDSIYDGTYIVSDAVADTFKITATFTVTGTGTLKLGFVDIVGVGVESPNLERFAFVPNPNVLTATNLEPKKSKYQVNAAGVSNASANLFEIAALQNNKIV